MSPQHKVFELCGMFTTLLFISRAEEDTDVWQGYADRIFPKFEEKVQGGALIWNLDCRYASWSMKGLEEKMGVHWNL